MEDSAFSTSDSRLIDMSLDEIIRLNRKKTKPFVNKTNFQTNTPSSNRGQRGRTPLNRKFVNNRQRGSYLNQRGQFRQLAQNFKSNASLRQIRNRGFKQNLRQNFAANKRSNFKQNLGNGNKNLLQYKQVLQRATILNQQRGIKVQTTAGTRFRGKNFANRAKRINRSYQNTNSYQNTTSNETDLITISISNNLAAAPRNRKWGSQSLLPNMQQPTGVKGLKPELSQTCFTLNDRFSGTL